MKLCTLMVTTSYFVCFSAQQTCSVHGFALDLANECSVEALRASYQAFLAAPENQIIAQSSCGADHLDTLLNSQDVESLCRDAINKNGAITFDDIVEDDSKFVESFYRGNTFWNEEVQTNYKLNDPNGPTTNVLKKYIAQVPLYYELAERKR